MNGLQMLSFSVITPNRYATCQDGNFSHALFYHLLFSFSQKFIDSVKRIFSTLVFHIVIDVEVVKPNSIPYIVLRL